MKFHCIKHKFSVTGLKSATPEIRMVSLKVLNYPGEISRMQVDKDKVSIKQPQIAKKNGGQTNREIEKGVGTRKRQKSPLIQDDEIMHAKCLTNNREMFDQ